MTNKSYDPQPVMIQGHELVCPVCKNVHFYEGKALLNTAGMTFFGLDWANKEARIFTCSKCTCIFWFRD